MIWLLIDSRTIGGAERHVATLAHSLQRFGLESEVLLYADYGHSDWLDQLAADGLAHRRLGGTFRSLLNTIAAERPSLLHTHGYKAGILGRLASVLTATPVVSTFHAGERARYPVAAYQFIDSWTSFLSHRIAVSDEIGRRLPFSAAVIPSFVAKTPEPAAGEVPKRVAFVGRLSFEKGPDRFCALARRAPPGLEWHVYGDGPMRKELEAEHGGIVHFHGNVADVQSVWSHIGLLLMPSRFEGVPLAALEAMSAGVPVLASRVGGLGSVVAHGATGWLFEDGNLDQALQYIAEWRKLSSQAHTAIRKSCRRRIEERFSEPVILPQIIEVYRSAGFHMPMTTGAAAMSGT